MDLGQLTKDYEALWDENIALTKEVSRLESTAARYKQCTRDLEAVLHRLFLAASAVGLRAGSEAVSSTGLGAVLEEVQQQLSKC